MDTENKSMVSRIQQETRESRVTIDYRPRNVTMRYVSDQELQTIGSASMQSAIHLAFFGLFGGAAVTLGATLKTVNITDPRTFAAFWAVFILSIIGVVYFGLRAFSDLREAQRQINTIREESPGRDNGDGG